VIINYSPEGKIPLGRPRSRWKDIRMVLREIWWEDVDLIHMAQNRDLWGGGVLVNMVINFP
jgi:hypothetical protein